MAQAEDDQIYTSCSPGQLPDQYRTLLDPAVALPEEIIYIKRDYSPNSAALVVTAIPAVFAVIMTIADALQGKLVFKEWIALFSVFTAPLLLCLYLNHRSSKLGKAIEEGRLRMGLFLTKTALLVRMTPDSCSVLPRRWISRFDETVLNPGRAGRRGTFTIRVYYRLQEAQQVHERHISFDCPQLQGFIFNDLKLLELLANWLGIPAGSTSSTPAPPRTQKSRGPRTPDEISKAKHETWLAAEAIRLQQEADRPAGPKPRKIQPILEHGLPKHHWERHGDDGTNYFVSLGAQGTVISYENWRNNVHSEMGGSVTFEEFLGGDYQRHIANDFDMTTLEEIIASIEYFKAHPEALKRIESQPL